MKITLCAGGTGGHLFPAIVLVKSFSEKGHDTSIITDERGNIYCEKIDNKDVLKTIKFSSQNIFIFIGRLIKIVLHFLKKWHRDKPDVFIGFGGILTVIPAIIAKLYGVKIVIYEQNSIVGRANRFLSQIADLKLSMFSMGNDWSTQAAPVRPEFFKNSSYKIGKTIRILIIGGSQGARSFSSLIPIALQKLMPEERKQLEIVQQESYNDEKELKTKYDKIGVKSHIKRFIHNIADEMEKCQLVICRAGASTLSELSAIGRPAILIPYPKATDNHQLLNAKRYSSKNACWIVEEGACAEEKLMRVIRNILKNKELLKYAASSIINNSLKDAASDFVLEIEKLSIKNEKVSN